MCKQTCKARFKEPHTLHLLAYTARVNKQARPTPDQICILPQLYLPAPNNLAPSKKSSGRTPKGFGHTPVVDYKNPLEIFGDLFTSGQGSPSALGSLGAELHYRCIVALPNGPQNSALTIAP